MKPTTLEALQLFQRGSEALARMESRGLRVDVDYVNTTLAGAEKTIKEKQDVLKKEPEWKLWKKRFGTQAKLTSQDQLAAVLFKDMKYPCTNYTATGKPATDEATISKTGNEFVKRFLSMKKVIKAKSTYLTNIRREVTPEGLFHPNFSLHLTETYRSSSGGDRESDVGGGDFNFQNIPTRNPEIAELVRRSFIPRKGRRIVEIDYSQIEVRVAACYHKDPTMLRYINDPTTDMHRDTAMELFGLDKTEGMTKLVRHIAKNMFVFPQFYGSYYLDCARSIWESLVNDNVKFNPTKGDAGEVLVVDHLKRLGIKRLGDQDEKAEPKKGTFEYHVKEIEKKFWNERFPVYTKWKKDWYQRYLKTGGLQMFTGFRCDGIMRRNQVINYPIQGPAFHCLLWSIVRIEEILRKKKMKSFLLGQVHDCIVGDVVESELEDYLRICRQVMTIELPKVWKWICVPLAVEAEVAPPGMSWFHKKKMEFPDGLIRLST